MSLDDLMQVFKYSSVAAVRKANLRGTFPVALRRLPKCSKWFAMTREVAECLSLAFDDIKENEQTEK